MLRLPTGSSAHLQKGGRALRDGFGRARRRVALDGGVREDLVVVAARRRLVAPEVDVSEAVRGKELEAERLQGTGGA